MSKQGSKSHKKVKRDEKSDSDTEDDLQPVHFFIPGGGMNAAVVVEYITQYVDRTAKITSSHHPTVRSKSRIATALTMPRIDPAQASASLQRKR